MGLKEREKASISYVLFLVHGRDHTRRSGLLPLWPEHLSVLAALVLACVLGSIWYRRMGEKGRNAFRKTVALLMMADELFKDVSLLVLGLWTPEYLPLHLCNINLFVVTFHAFRPGKPLGLYLYTVCIPGALAALLFPSWTVLPPWNFMYLHSTLAHILLVLYPVALTVAGDIRPEPKQLPKSLMILVCLAVMAALVNICLGTNFFFLDHADPGNPLYIFEQAFGSHLIGFPVIIAGVLLVMHGPWLLFRRPEKVPSGRK